MYGKVIEGLIDVELKDKQFQTCISRGNEEIIPERILKTAKGICSELLTGSRFGRK